MSSRLRKTVSTEDAGVRLDKYLCTFEEISSRSRAAKLIDEGRVTVNGQSAKASLVVLAGEKVEIDLPLAKPAGLARFELSLDILYEDADVLVVDKPAGLVVHPAAGHVGDTLVNALVAHTKDLSMGFGEDRPGIVHRLDKETSGLLVVAKNDRAHHNLVEQFQARSIHRLYQAVVLGEMVSPAGTFQSYLARHPTDRKRFASVIGPDRKIQREPEPISPHGKWAVTDYRRLAKNKGLSFVELRLRTGRTHQIRVHLSEIGHPLVGDDTYGAEKKVKSLPSVRLREQIAELRRFLLHARELGFTHPKSGERLHFTREWPEADLALIKEWGFAP